MILIIYFQKALYGTSFNNEYNDRGAHFSVFRKIDNGIEKHKPFPKSKMHEYGQILNNVGRKPIFGLRKIDNRIEKPEPFPKGKMHKYGQILNNVRRNPIFDLRERPTTKNKYYRKYPISNQRTLRLYFVPRNHKYFL